MEIGNLIPHIEALIFASEKPLTALELTDLINNAFGFMEDKIVLDQVETALEGIVEKYKSEFYPFEVRESGGGWQFLTKRDYHKTVAQLNGDKFLKRLSTAALEALSIIAYKQPVTKSEIEAIRGVSSDYAIQKLLEKELIMITGRNEELPGHPLVYCTSKNFMDYFGINSPEDLPKLKEVFDDAIVAATNVEDATAAETPLGAGQRMDEDGASLIVGPDGELIEEDTEIAEEGGETEASGEHMNGESVAFDGEEEALDAEYEEDEAVEEEESNEDDEEEDGEEDGEEEEVDEEDYSDEEEDDDGADEEDGEDEEDFDEDEESEDEEDGEEDDADDEDYEADDDKKPSRK